MENAAFTLRDPRPVQAEAPYTFFLPDPRQIGAVAPGDIVKLIFAPTGDGRQWDAERMWVEVVSVDGASFKGTLDNIPDDIPGLSLGDLVEFQGYHIISVQFPDEEKTRKHRYPARDYFDRCLVDQCILDGEVKVEYIYRETADLANEGDPYPDSGWRIRGDGRGYPMTISTSGNAPMSRWALCSIAMTVGCI